MSRLVTEGESRPGRFHDNVTVQVLQRKAPAMDSKSMRHAIILRSLRSTLAVNSTKQASKGHLLRMVK